MSFRSRSRGAELEAKFLFLCRPIGGIWEVGRLILHVGDRPCHFFHEFRAPDVQQLLEMLKLLVVHVGLATGGFVGFEVIETL